MPRRTLSVITMAPKMKKSAATASSALFRRNAGLSALMLLARDEAGGLHQLHVARLFARDPARVLLAGERGGVERALFHQLLPLRRCHDFLEQAGVVGDVLGLHARRHEDAAQHQVVDVEPGLLAGRNVAPA